MADPDNPGQFGNRLDSAERAKKGVKVEKGSKRASEAGKKGTEHQPMEAKRRGGENSHRIG